jgi:hypothetical protein
VVTSHAGRPLADLLEASDGLLPGQVVTLLVPLANTLAALHARGLVHGAVGPAAVVVGPDGRAGLLDATGGRAPDATSADDVRRLARLGRQALRDPEDAPTALLSALDAAEAADASAPEPAARLAAALLRSCPALPLPLAIAAPDARRSRRLPVMAVGGVLALAAAVSVGAFRGGAQDRPRVIPPADVAALPAAAPEPTSLSNWRGIVSDLEHRRIAAIHRRDLGALRRIYLRSAPERRRDAALVRGLITRDWTVHGQPPTVQLVNEVTLRTDRAVLRVTNTLSAATMRDADGRVVQRSHAHHERVVVTLVRRAGGWRIAGVAQPRSARSAASTSS